MMRARSTIRWTIPIVWAAAMFIARRSDPWITIATAALALTIAIFASDGALIRRLLRPTRRIALFSLVGAATMLAATYLLGPQLFRWLPVVREKSAEIYSQFLSVHKLPFVVALVVPIIVAEEILWRGAFQEAMGARSKTVTVILSALVYALAHITLGSPLLVAIAFVCGLYWSGLRSVSGSLLPSLAAHMFWDLALILIPL